MSLVSVWYDKQEFVQTMHEHDQLYHRFEVRRLEQAFDCIRNVFSAFGRADRMRQAEGGEELKFDLCFIPVHQTSMALWLDDRTFVGLMMSAEFDERATLHEFGRMHNLLHELFSFFSPDRCMTLGGRQHVQLYLSAGF